MCSGQHPQSRCSSQETVQSGVWSGGKVDRQNAVWPVFGLSWLGQALAFDPVTSPLGLLLLHDLLALLSPSFVDGVAWVVDLEGVLVVHVGILDFSGLLIKLQNMGHPKSDRERGERVQRRAAEDPLKHSSLRLCQDFASSGEILNSI